MYCTTRNVKIKLVDTPKAIPKKLVSPILEPKTKLSPIAPLQKVTEQMKSKATQSVLFNITKGKRKTETMPMQESKDITKGKGERPVEASLITVTLNENGEEIIEEIKTLDNSGGFVDKANSVKRTPWIDQTKLSKLVLSPLSNAEGIRHTKKDPDNTPPEESKGGNSAKTIVMCGCGQPCDMKNENQCSDCLAKLQPGTQCGYLYERADDKNLWRSYYKLMGTHLYRNEFKIILGYRAKTDELPSGMYSLIGSFIKEELQEIMDGKRVMAPFVLFFGANRLKLYALKKEEQEKWINALKDAIGYTKLTDYYELKVNN